MQISEYGLKESNFQKKVWRAHEKAVAGTFLPPGSGLATPGLEADIQPNVNLVIFDVLIEKEKIQYKWQFNKQKLTKGELNVRATVCSVFFFRDAYASMKGTKHFFLKTKIIVIFFHFWSCGQMFFIYSVILSCLVFFLYECYSLSIEYYDSLKEWLSKSYSSILTLQRISIPVKILYVAHKNTASLLWCCKWEMFNRHRGVE